MEMLMDRVLTGSAIPAAGRSSKVRATDRCWAEEETAQTITNRKAPMILNRFSMTYCSPHASACGTSVRCQLPLPDKSCQLRRSMQHLLGVYSLEFGILEFFLDVDSSAARPGRAALE